MDSPLIASAKSHFKVAEHLENPKDFLIQLMMTSENQHEAASAYLALWVLTGTDPSDGMVLNSFLRGVTALAQAVMRDRVGRERVSFVREVFIEPVQGRLTTAVTGANGGYILGPSRLASLEAQALRDKNGSNHVGSRFERAKPKGFNGMYAGNLRAKNVISF